MREEINGFVATIDGLASHPSWFSQVQWVLKNQGASLEEIAHVVSADPNLSARVLRAANGSFYGQSRKVDRLEDAVQLLGIQRLQELVLATFVTEYFRDISPDFVDMESFWKHSVCCAVTARELSRFGVGSSPEGSYLSGLLHDIGRLALCLGRPEAVRTLFVELCSSKQSLLELERQILGFDHAEVGGALLESWSVPEQIVEGVRWHHAPKLDEQDSPDSAVLYLADQLAHAFEFGCSGEIASQPLENEVWRKVKLSTVALDPLFSTIRRELKASALAFGLRPPGRL